MKSVLTLAASLVLLAGCGDGSNDSADATADGKTKPRPPASIASASDAPDETEPVVTADPEPVVPALPEIPEQSEAPDDSKPVAVETPKRDTLDGRWTLELHQFARIEFEPKPYWIPIALVEIEKSDDGSLKVASASATPAIGDATFEDSAITADSAMLKFKLASSDLTFTGRFRDGTVIGDAWFSAGRCTAARLAPTKHEVAGAATPAENPLAREYLDAANSNNNAETLREFIAQHPQTPMALDAYDRLAMEASANSLSVEDVNSLVAEYEKAAEHWGARRKQMVKLDVALNLAGTRYLPELALKLFADVEQSLDDDTASWKDVIERGSQSAKLGVAVANLESDDDAVRQSAIDSLTAILADDPFNPELLLTLARHDEKAGNVDSAIERFGTLAVMPLMERMIGQMGLLDSPSAELPSETVGRLYEAKHGSTEGLDEVLDQLYQKVMDNLKGEPVPPRGPDDGNRIALVELFTGAQCPPCVAGDLSTGVIETSYQHSEVIVIRYHQHVPGPDPMATLVGEERMQFYRLQGTPSIRVNGRDFAGNPTGGMPQVAPAERALRAQIEPILLQKSPITIQAAASLENDSIQMSVNANGVSGELDSARLRVVLVEDHVSFRAGNGIRSHEMIVRWMPAGPNGVEVSSGSASFEDSLSLDEVRKQLNAGLDETERFFRSAISVRPMELKHLHLIAFVQNDSTQEVLQSVSVPVTTAESASD